MANPTSTETSIIVSLWCQRMPMLKKTIEIFSSPGGKVNEDILTPLFYPAQIDEARNHSSTIIQQALKATSVVQQAINDCDKKIEHLLALRKEAEAEVTKAQELKKKKEEAVTEEE